MESCDGKFEATPSRGVDDPAARRVKKALDSIPTVADDLQLIDVAQGRARAKLDALVALLFTSVKKCSWDRT